MRWQPAWRRSGASCPPFFPGPYPVSCAGSGSRPARCGKAPFPVGSGSAFCPVAPRGGEDAGCGRNEAVRTLRASALLDGNLLVVSPRRSPSSIAACADEPHGTGCSVIWLRSYTARKSTMVFSRLSSAASPWKKDGGGVRRCARTIRRACALCGADRTAFRVSCIVRCPSRSGCRAGRCCTRNRR